MWGKIQKKGLKKDQLLIGLLTGILLVVIALPVEKGMGKTDEERNQENAGEMKSQGDSGEEAVWSETPGEDSGETESSDNLTGDAYTRQMEERLSHALSQVEGVGKVEVMITWKTSSEKVVEKDIPGNSQVIEEEDSTGGKRVTRQESQEESTVYREGEDGTRSPYVIKEIRPQAEGVLVIAQGGGNPVTVRNILEAVQALFPLDSHKIKIMKMEGSK
ncbi:MAG: stage III sporulation protein AG [Lachnospiraceae bacterium]|nr:stage III sporulation protein AG [Lachnospiraceae bacterium]